MTTSYSEPPQNWAACQTGRVVLPLLLGDQRVGAQTPAALVSSGASARPFPWSLLASSIKWAEMLIPPPSMGGGMSVKTLAKGSGIPAQSPGGLHSQGDTSPVCCCRVEWGPGPVGPFHFLVPLRAGPTLSHTHLVPVTPLPAGEDTFSSPLPIGLLGPGGQAPVLLPGSPLCPSSWKRAWCHLLERMKNRIHPRRS